MDPPIIEPNYLSHDSDVETFIAGIEFARRIAAAHAFEEYCGDEYLPGKGVQSRGEIAGYVRDAAETTYHPAGTCKMGADAMAVVDSHLRVRGVENLRVVDAVSYTHLRENIFAGAHIFLALGVNACILR